MWMQQTLWCQVFANKASLWYLLTFLVTSWTCPRIGIPGTQRTGRDMFGDGKTSQLQLWSILWFQESKHGQRMPTVHQPIAPAVPCDPDVGRLRQESCESIGTSGSSATWHDYCPTSFRGPERSIRLVRFRSAGGDSLSPLFTFQTVSDRAGSLWSFFHLTLDHALNYTPSCCKFSGGLCTNALGNTGCWVWTFIGNSLQMQNWKHCHFLLALNCHTATIGDEQEGHQSKVARLPWNNLGSWILLRIKWNILRCRLFAKEALELINLFTSAIDCSDYRLRTFNDSEDARVGQMENQWQWYMREVCAHAYLQILDYINKIKLSIIYQYQIYLFWVLCLRWWWLPWPCFFTGGVFL